MMLLLKKFGKAVGGLVKSVMDDSVSAYSAQAAFFMIISAFPMVMLMLTMLKYLPYFSDGVPIINIRFLPADLNLFVQKMLQEIIPGSSLEILEGLYHGEYSINHPDRYVRDLLEMTGQSPDG